ncbi:MAG: acyl carrier protein [Rhodococcus sp.]|nr:acyl carrier protein [Rhodococcus sp. (in: high G+C Gram-positive bacteria)]
MATIDARSLQLIVDREFPHDDYTVDLDASFEDSGFDSLSVFELGSALAKEFGVRLSDEDLIDCETFGDLAALVTVAPGQAASA